MISPLHGRTVLITGAARGIGEQLARLAAARGARVMLVGLEPERLEALTEELNAGASTGPHRWFGADVTDQAALDHAARGTVQATGRLDVVVANAGIANIGTVAVSPADALVRTIDVNLSGVVRTVAATLPMMRAHRGYYLLISSAAAFTALPGMAAYCASKAGVEQFGNVLRQETAGVGVGVGTAHPSWIDTDMVRDMRASLPSMTSGIAKLPWPLSTTLSVEDCAQALIRAVERRRRRVYVPAAVAGVAALRTVMLSAAADALIRLGGGAMVDQLEADTRSLGRSFGPHSVEQASGGHATP